MQRPGYLTLTKGMCELEITCTGQLHCHIESCISINGFRWKCSHMPQTIHTVYMRDSGRLSVIPSPRQLTFFPLPFSFSSLGFGKAKNSQAWLVGKFMLNPHAS